MCGIAGFFDADKNLHDLKIMTDRLLRRGPDAEGFFEENGVFLGHRRLSIIDLSSAANQPFYSQNQRYVMVFNGEIYNYLEIAKDLNLQLKTQSDTEVVIESFVKEGIQCFSRFNGMFALAIFDRETHKIFIARDKVGEKPLFYSNIHNKLEFASEIKALLSQKNINEISIASFLHFGYIPEPNTFFQNIFKFKSGHYGIFENGKLTQYPFWKIEDAINKQSHKNYQSTKAHLKQLIENSVELRMRADVPFGCFLSGGTDSSLVTAIAQKIHPQKIQTFSIGFKENSHNESIFAKKVAEHLKTEHYELMLEEKDAIEQIALLHTIYDEPFADSSFIPTLLVSKMASKEVKMVLSGDGGDELFMGYGAYNWAKRLNNPFIKISKPVLGKILSLGNNQQKRASKMFEKVKDAELYSHIFSQEQYLFSKKELDELLINKSVQSFAFFNNGFARELSPEEFQSLIDFKTYLKDDLLVKVDRASMFHSLECRVPLLDPEIAEYAINIDKKFKIKGTEQKYILKDILCDFLPKEMVYRRKWGFSIPLGKWMKNELDYLIKVLKSENEPVFEYVSFKKTKDLINRFEAGEDYLYNRIWLLIVLNINLRKF